MNDGHTTDSDLTHFWFGQEQIKTYHHGKKLIEILFYAHSRSESNIFNGSFIEESESKIFHKSINTNKGKYAIDETDDEETLVTDNPVINETIYFKLFECGRKYLEQN